MHIFTFIVILEKYVYPMEILSTGSQHTNHQKNKNQCLHWVLQLFKAFLNNSQSFIWKENNNINMPILQMRRTSLREQL